MGKYDFKVKPEDLTGLDAVKVVKFSTRTFKYINKTEALKNILGNKDDLEKAVEVFGEGDNIKDFNDKLNDDIFGLYEYMMNDDNIDATLELIALCDKVKKDDVLKYNSEKLDFKIGALVGSTGLGRVFTQAASRDASAS
jgi:hypothetical protein